MSRKYGAALVMAALAVIVRIALTPLIGKVELAFTIPLVAILFASWYGGLGAGATCTLVSAIATEYFIFEPAGSFVIRNRSDGISLVVFVILGFGIAVLADGRRRAVERALRAEGSERDERERFQTTLSSIGDAVIATDAEGRVTFANQVALSLLRRPEVDVSGKPLGAVFRIVNEETRATVESPVDRVLRDGRIAVLGNHTILIAGDGTETPIDDSAAPIRSANGAMQGTVLVFRDITDRRRAEQQRAELLAKERALTAERALREVEAELARVVRALSVGELATSIAHEINQPLAGVVTNAEAGLRWLSGEAPNIEEARASLGLIARDGSRASAVILRIREYLKKEGPRTVSLGIRELIEETLALAGAELAKRQVGVRIEVSDGLPRISGDRIQLQQVLLNLIMNGADAMALIPGPKELLVSSEASSDASIVIAVRDTGIGISPDAIPRMFDAFFTTKPSGMGMGLSISRSIVEGHGGRIWAVPNEGPGLTVRFRLPAEPANQIAGKGL